MDLEGIKITNRFRQIEQGDFFSDEVKTRATAIEEMTDEEKQRLLVEAFAKAIEIAEELTSLPRFDPKSQTLDLTDIGLGKVRIDLYEHAGDESYKPHKGLEVEPNGAFQYQKPSSSDIDPCVFVNDDGEVDIDMDKINLSVTYILDYLETLQTIKAELAKLS